MHLTTRSTTETELRLSWAAAVAPPPSTAVRIVMQPAPAGWTSGKAQEWSTWFLTPIWSYGSKEMVFVKTGPYNISDPVRFGSVQSDAKGPLFARSDRTLYFFSLPIYIYHFVESPWFHFNVSFGWQIQLFELCIWLKDSYPCLLEVKKT